MPLYWPTRKPSGAYEFKDASGRKTGAFVKHANCFGTWDPIRGHWTLYPERIIERIEKRTAPCGVGYGTYPGEPNVADQIFNHCVTFTPIQNDLPYMNTALFPMLQAMRTTRSDDLDLAEHGWGTVFMGGSTGAERQMQGRRILSKREELSLASTSLVRYYTPSLRHVSQDPGVLKHIADFRDSNGNAVVDPLVPLGNYANKRYVVPDVCEAYSPPTSVPMHPIAEYNVTNNVYIMPVDIDGRFYKADETFAAERYDTERKRDEQLVPGSATATLRLPVRVGGALGAGCAEVEA